MTNSRTTRYARRITRVLRHIESHLDDDLSINALSAVAHFSPYHFHRQFSAYTGIGVGRLVQLFRLRRASMQLVFNPRASIFDIAHDASFTNAESFSRDPATTPFEDYRLDICVSVTQPVAPNPQGVVTKSIPAGRCARVRHVGSRHNVHPADWIYREWLPQSGEQLRNFPIFFHYVNVGPDVKEHELITDVYLPLI